MIPITRCLKFLLICCLLLCGLNRDGMAQDSTQINIARTFLIHSKILGEDRKIYIYTPSTVPGFTVPQGPYPVMYLTDAEFQLPLVAGLVDYLSKSQGIILPMIIVGIDNNHYDRERDLTPTHSNKADPLSKPDTSAHAFTKTSGGGERFIQFIKQELMPWVDAHYPTAPYRVFSGHSLGGLSVLYSLFRHPDLFNAYIGISPSVWWDEGAILKIAGKAITAQDLHNRKLFFSISSEGGVFYADIQKLNTLLEEHPKTGLQAKYIHYPGETHGSSPAKGEYDALKFIFAGCYPSPADSTATRIEQFEQRFYKRFGYQAIFDENALINFGYNALNDPQRMDEGIKLFLMATRYFANSSNAFDSLGDGWAKKGEKQKAIAAYQKAIDLHSADFTEDSRKKLKALQ